LISIVRRKGFSMATRPRWGDLALLLVIAVQAAMVFLYFQKYPIFPEYQSADFAAHVQFAENLLAGSAVSIPSGILYYGVHFQLASSLLLVGGEPLVTVRTTMAILALLSPLVFYLAASEMFDDARAGLVVAVVYSLSANIWFGSVFNSGLYANFFGILSVLFLLYCFVALQRRLNSPTLWVEFMLAVGMTYFSHYTAITIFPALFSVPLVKFLVERKVDFKLLAPPTVAAAPGAVAVLANPGLARLILGLAAQGGGALVGSTWLASLLSGLPVASYMALLVFDDVAFVFLFAFLAVCLFQGWTSKRVVFVLPLIWFFSLFALAPLNVSAWRFSFEALVPFTIMAGYGIFTMLPKGTVERRRRGSTRYVRLAHARVALVSLVLLSLIIVGSWGTTMVSDSLTGARSFANAQEDVYSAIYWLGSHTPTSSVYLSVSDYRFIYTNVIIGRTTEYNYEANQSDGIAAAEQLGATYIIVTKAVTLSLPPVASLFPWNNYQGNSNLTLVYSNDDVRVFQIA
jgi:hypothetical protein